MFFFLVFNIDLFQLKIWNRFRNYWINKNTSILQGSLKFSAFKTKPFQEPQCYFLFNNIFGA